MDGEKYYKLTTKGQGMKEEKMSTKYKHTVVEEAHRSSQPRYIDIYNQSEETGEDMDMYDSRNGLLDYVGIGPSAEDIRDDDRDRVVGTSRERVNSEWIAGIKLVGVRRGTESTWGTSHMKSTDCIGGLSPSLESEAKMDKSPQDSVSVMKEIANNLLPTKLSTCTSPPELSKEVVSNDISQENKPKQGSYEVVGIISPIDIHKKLNTISSKSQIKVSKEKHIVSATSARTDGQIGKANSTFGRKRDITLPNRKLVRAKCGGPSKLDGLLKKMHDKAKMAKLVMSDASEIIDPGHTEWQKNNKTYRKIQRKADAPRKVHRCQHCYNRFQSDDLLLKHICSAKPKPTNCVVHGDFLNLAEISSLPQKPGREITTTYSKYTLQPHFGRPMTHNLPVGSNEWLSAQATSAVEKARAVIQNKTTSKPVLSMTKSSLSSLQTKTGGSSDRKWNCDVCGDQFADSSSLSTHLQSTHLDLSTHSCSQCTKSFYLKENLRKHVVLCHPDTRPRPWVCPHCTRPFLTKRHLSSHLSTHSREKPHVCADCGRTFRRSSNLQQHAKAMHKPSSK